jgi:hypothetical protein
MLQTLIVVEEYLVSSSVVDPDSLNPDTDPHPALVGRKQFYFNFLILLLLDPDRGESSPRGSGSWKHQSCGSGSSISNESGYGSNLDPGV